MKIADFFAKTNHRLADGKVQYHLVSPGEHQVRVGRPRIDKSRVNADSNPNTGIWVDLTCEEGTFQSRIAVPERIKLRLGPDGWRAEGFGSHAFYAAKAISALEDVCDVDPVSDAEAWVTIDLSSFMTKLGTAKEAFTVTVQTDEWEGELSSSVRYWGS